MTTAIEHRYTSATLYTSETAAAIMDALEEAVSRGANLDGANLRGANLGGASLVNANLGGANLVNASLVGASLRGANLDGASLEPIRDDLYTVLDTARAEVPGLLAALRAGQIDGSTYTGECACLVGTIANVRQCSVRDLACDSSRPVERFFLALRPGHTPSNHPVAEIVERWIVDYCARHEIATERIGGPR